MSDFFPPPSMMVVLSLFMFRRLHVPISFKPIFSNLTPRSSEMTFPPVKMAMSSIMAFLLSPKPGAFTATHFRVPRILLTTSVARASPSTSSAIITRGLPIFAICSNMGSISFMLLIFFSTSRIYGPSRLTSIFPRSVTK